MKSRGKRILIIIGGLLLILMICMFSMPNTKKLKFNGAEVEYIYNGEKVTDVHVDGPFLYGLITSYPDEEYVRDIDGNITEIIQTYVMEAAFSLNQRMNMKVHIETSEDIKYTYIFKYADKDVTIINGKVVDK